MGGAALQMADQICEARLLLAYQQYWSGTGARRDGKSKVCDKKEKTRTDTVYALSLVNYGFCCNDLVLVIYSTCKYAVL